MNNKNNRYALRTKQLLSRALNDLMLEKEYSQISISELVAKAELSRSAFYSHFEAKEDLLRYLIRATFKNLDIKTDDYKTYTVNSLSKVTERILAKQELFYAIRKNGLVYHIVETLVESYKDIFTHDYEHAARVFKNKDVLELYCYYSIAVMIYPIVFMLGTDFQCSRKAIVNGIIGVRYTPIMRKYKAEIENCRSKEQLPPPVLTPEERAAKRKHRTKKQICEAFVELMEEKPFAAITMLEIARKADMSRATCYNHFKTKNDILKYQQRIMIVEIEKRYMKTTEAFGWTDKAMQRIEYFESIRPFMAAITRDSLEEYMLDYSLQWYSDSEVHSKMAKETMFPIPDTQFEYRLNSLFGVVNASLILFRYFSSDLSYEPAYLAKLIDKFRSMPFVDELK